MTREICPINKVTRKVWAVKQEVGIKYEFIPQPEWVTIVANAGWGVGGPMETKAYVLLESLDGKRIEWKLLDHVWLFVTPWSIQSMEFSRPEYWSGWPFSSSRDLPNPGAEPRSPSWQAGSLPAEPPGKPKVLAVVLYKIKRKFIFSYSHFFMSFKSSIRNVYYS